MGYEDNYVIPPSWDIQQTIPVHKAHYHFVPSQSNYLTHRDARGHEDAVNRLLYYRALPTDAKLQDGFGGLDLVVENIPALPDEEFAPPLGSYDYRVIFYYSPQRTGEEFWKSE